MDFPPGHDSWQGQRNWCRIGGRRRQQHRVSWPVVRTLHFHKIDTGRHIPVVRLARAAYGILPRLRCRIHKSSRHSNQPDLRGTSCLWTGWGRGCHFPRERWDRYRRQFWKGVLSVKNSRCLCKGYRFLMRKITHCDYEFSKYICIVFLGYIWINYPLRY